MMNALTIIYPTYWAISGSSTLGLFNFYCIVRRRVFCLLSARSLSQPTLTQLLPSTPNGMCNQHSDVMYYICYFHATAGRS